MKLTAISSCQKFPLLSYRPSATLTIDTLTQLCLDLGDETAALVWNHHLSPRKPCVMSHNTHLTFANKTWLVPSHGNHPCHLHMSSKIPGTLFPHSNSDVINF